ncbi:PspC domain-containing protein [Edaphocola flava]|uniref:PspC domain-containing protein n=1 Tax=Edaphocola flava TaxID=2499629 RepID=UPI00100B422E|nr:PspC domain-containing protein [Edaphocola flava]
MNKVINISLAGRLLPIDEEAYSQLTNYLNWLKQYFGKEKGGMEIYSDMEDRIAELFHDKLKKDNISISANDVQSVIKIMGSPEQIVMETSDEYIMAEEAGTTAQQQTGNGPAEAITNLTSPSGKRFVRNTNDKLLGGVCSGAASYLNLDVTVVRIVFLLFTLFYGSSILLYLLLWIALPQYAIPTTQLKRRLYRDLDGKLLGGVCKGLSSYVNVSVNWVRLFFVFPLMGIIFFNIINEDDLASFCAAMFPTLIILYIVLWAILPKASTLTEKMELRGEKIDVQNLSAALKTENSNTAVKPRQDNIATILLKIIAYGILFFVLGIFAIVLLSILAGLLGLLFGFSTAGAVVMPFADIIFEQSWQPVVLYISATLAVLIPIIFIVRWLVHIARKPQRTNKWVGYSLGIGFLVSVFMMFYIITDVLSDIKREYSVTESIPMAQPTDTLLIEPMTDSVVTGGLGQFSFVRETVKGGYEFEVMSVNVVASPDSMYHLNLIRKSNGRDIRTAQRYAAALPFTFRQDSNTVRFPRYLSLGGTKVFRGQLLTAEIQVPKGKAFRMGAIPKSFSQQWHLKTGGGYTINIKQHPRWSPNTVYKVEENGSIVSVP